MPNGYELFNNQGYKMGGSDYVNMVFRGKTRITTTAYSFSGLPSDQPQLVIGSAPVPSGGTFRAYRSVSGHKCMEQGGRIFSDTIGAVFDCYSFGPIVDRGSREGMQIFNEQQVLTFDLESPYLKLVGVFTDPTPVVVPNYQNEGANAGPPYSVGTPYVEGAKQYATLLGNSHFYYYRTITGNEARIITDHIRGRIARIAPNGVFETAYMDMWIWRNPTATEQFINEIANKTAPMRMLVVDVTGL